MLQEGTYNEAKISFALQTNGTLVDDEWIELFSRHNVHASISLDGPKSINDKNRVNKRGNSTYYESVRGLTMLQNAWRKGILPSEPGILSVANPNENGREIYEHFTKELGCNQFDFLIPDESFDSNCEKRALGRFLNEALDAWFNDGKSDVFIRIFNTYLGSLLKENFNPILGMSHDVNSAYAFTVTSDGGLY